MKTLKQIWNLPVTVISAYVKERKRIIKLTDDMIDEANACANKYTIIAGDMIDEAVNDHLNVMSNVLRRKHEINDEFTELGNTVANADRSLSVDFIIDLCTQCENRGDELEEEWDELDLTVSLSEHHLGEIRKGSTM